MLKFQVALFVMSDETDKTSIEYNSSWKASEVSKYFADELSAIQYCDKKNIELISKNPNIKDKTPREFYNVQNRVLKEDVYMSDWNEFLVVYKDFYEHS